MKKNDNSENQVRYLPIYMSIGISVGVAIGAALDNIGVWMCIGMSVGVGLGAALDHANRAKNKDSDEKAQKED